MQDGIARNEREFGHVENQYPMNHSATDPPTLYNSTHLREDALAIWQAGVDGVAPNRLIRENVLLNSNVLDIAGVSYPLSDIRRIVVVGGGKASGRMAEELESVLSPLLDGKGPEVVGWINVPNDCAVPLQKIRLHSSRPMGVNEPTEAAAFGTHRIVEFLKSLGPNDLCINLLSGGGSALMPAPPPKIPLAEKLELTRFLSGAGADIHELNTVRKQISLLKGGKMKELCRGCRLVSLILSDVLGDPLDVIASGPTVDNPGSAADALAVLQKFATAPATVAQKTAIQNVVLFLQRKCSHPLPEEERKKFPDEFGTIFDDVGGFVRNIIIGNNALAVDYATIEAERRGYSAVSSSATQSEGLAEDIGVRMIDQAIQMRSDRPKCLISGGEPVVRLAPTEIRGKGGRNQQLVLATLIHLLNDEQFRGGLVMISGGTDGEDGPTNAAGALFDDELFERLRNQIRDNPAFDPQRFLETNDAYSFFEALNGLVMTGPTGTNVCDLRVVVGV